MKKKGLHFFGLLFLLAGIIVSGSFFQKTADGYDRIKKEEACVTRFLREGKAASRRKKEANEKKTDEREVQDENWTDSLYYERDGIVYTPEYAVGYLDCVLEIPSIQLRRAVYRGSWEEIRKNLDVWMLTAARPDYELENTVYCIYGHNHPIQDLSFNRLQQLQIGDRFTLTNQTSILEYEITAVYGKSREDTTRQIVDNFSLSPQECYLITCGRGKYRYLDFIVQGTLVQRSDLL